ncbi:acyltransferase family protein [Glaciecola sp. 2405UD65-10]|uniref:acyltransferase family protein n=1 Tax=Glaciecola sp. 2405UD65-10 TaxID=3397244 RepID=UPI003B5B5ADB
MQSRTDWVDYAKAIGIILVVYGHVARGLFNAGISIPENAYTLADSIVYSFHMPLFFFLSGLFFYSSFTKKGGVKLTFNKVDTIIYPYLIWSILQGSVEVALSNYTNGNVTFIEVFSLWEPRAHFWFLYALFLVFIVSSIIFTVVSEKRASLVLAGSCVLYLASSLSVEVKLFPFITNNLVFFSLGIVFTRYNASKKLSSNAALLITMISFILAQFLFHGYLGKLYENKGVDTLLLAIISIFFIVSLSIAMAKSPNRLFAYVGASSMAIYLMHILVGSGARIILSKVLSVDSAITHLVIGCFTGVLLPLLALTIINKLKIPFVFSALISKYLTPLTRKSLNIKPD